tara:strand:- start:115 stop:510 length:396 start_codon:yes stop_codon:yes gene_type:complete
MSHFAKVDDNNIVTEVIVAEQEHADSLEGRWIQTSFNTRGGKHYDQDGNEDGGTPIRKNYAGIGMIYDETIDGFINEKPYASWTLNSTTGYWDPPIAVPGDEGPGKVYIWDEDNQSWTVHTDTTTAPIFPS